MRDRFGIFGTVTRFRELSLLLVMMLRIPNKHLKALFVKGRVDGQPMTKILVDGGAAINIMPYAVYRKLGKGDQDLT